MLDLLQKLLSPFIEKSKYLYFPFLHAKKLFPLHFRRQEVFFPSGFFSAKKSLPLLFSIKILIWPRGLALSKSRFEIECYFVLAPSLYVWLKTIALRYIENAVSISSQSLAKVAGKVHLYPLQIHQLCGSIDTVPFLTTVKGNFDN